MRKQTRTIQVDGKPIEGEYLGRGHYATAYQCGQTVYLLVKEDEHMKEVISQWIEDVPHVPAITKHEDVQVRGKWFQVYSMPFYRTIRASDREAWAILKTLSEAAERIFRAKYLGKLEVDGAYFNRDVIEETRGQVPESVTEALESLADAACNYGCGVSFEFGKRNIGVDDAGRIVFRDILFDAEKMGREMRQKLRASRGY